MSAVAASIKFTQGMTTDSFGRSVFGVLAVAVTCSPGPSPVQIKRYTWTVIDAPPASAITPGTVLSDGPSPTCTFTPDTAYGYLIQLTVYDSSGVTSTQRRVFGVKDVNSRFIPPYSALGSELNFAGQLRGASPFMEAFFAALVGSVVLFGDVTGASAATTVVRIQNRNVSAAAPANTNVLAWNAGANRWEPTAAGGGGGVPAGADTQVQFNDGGAFGGNAGLTFTKGSGILAVNLIDTTVAGVLALATVQATSVNAGVIARPWNFLGNVVVAGTLQAPSLDTAAAVALTLAPTNATSVDFTGTTPARWGSGTRPTTGLQRFAYYAAPQSIMRGMVTAGVEADIIQQNDNALTFGATSWITALEGFNLTVLGQNSLSLYFAGAGSVPTSGLQRFPYYAGAQSLLRGMSGVATEADIIQQSGFNLQFGPSTASFNVAIYGNNLNLYGPTSVSANSPYFYCASYGGNEAIRITPVSAGTTSITFANTVTLAQINQTQAAAGAGAPMSIIAQEGAAGSASGDLRLGGGPNPGGGGSSGYVQIMNQARGTLGASIGGGISLVGVLVNTIPMKDSANNIVYVMCLA